MELLPFKAPTYNDNNRVKCGMLSMVIPDGMEYVSAEHCPKGDERAKELLDNYLLVAAPKDTNGGLTEFRDATIGIDIIGPDPNFIHEDSWDIFIQNPKIVNGKISFGEGDLNFIVNNENLVIGYSKGNECQSSAEPYWVTYVFRIFTKNADYTANFFINYKKAQKSDYDNLLKEFCKHVEIDTSEAGDIKKNMLKDKFGPMVADNGKLDGVLITNLFSHDVIFNNDNEITFDGVHHHVSGIQLEASKADDYRFITDNSPFFASNLFDLMNYVENNENLMIPKESFHSQILKVTNNDPITGITLFTLCAWHMIFISRESENEYNIILDRNLIAGIPKAYSFIGEFVKTLREYNGLFDEFTLNVHSSMNFDAPINTINDRVKGADEHKSSYTYTIAKGENPYSSSDMKEYLKSGGEYEKEQEAKKRNAENAVKKEVREYFKNEQVPKILEAYKELAKAIKSSEKVNFNDEDDFADYINEIAYKIDNMNTEHNIWMDSSFHFNYTCQEIKHPHVSFNINYYNELLIPYGFSGEKPTAKEVQQFKDDVCEKINALTEDDIYDAFIDFGLILNERGDEYILVDKNGNEIGAKGDLKYKNEFMDLVKEVVAEAGKGSNNSHEYAKYDSSEENVTISVEVSGTMYEGRTERIEYVKLGDPVIIERDKDNEYDENALAVKNSKGESLGNIDAFFCRCFSPLVDRNVASITGANVSYVEPKSKRSARAKKAILYVELQIHINEIDYVEEPEEDGISSALDNMSSEEIDTLFNKVIESQFGSLLTMEEDEDELDDVVFDEEDDDEEDDDESDDADLYEEDKATISERDNNYVKYLLNPTYKEKRTVKASFCEFKIPDNFILEKEPDSNYEFVVCYPGEEGDDNFNAWIRIYGGQVENMDDSVSNVLDNFKKNEITSKGLINPLFGAINELIAIQIIGTTNKMSELMGLGNCDVIRVNIANKWYGAGYKRFDDNSADYCINFFTSEGVKTIRVDVFYEVFENLGYNPNDIFAAIKNLLKGFEIKNNKRKLTDINSKKFTKTSMDMEKYSEWEELVNNSFEQIDMTRALVINNINIGVDALTDNLEDYTKKYSEEVDSFLEYIMDIRDVFLNYMCEVIVSQQKLGCEKDILSKMCEKADELIKNNANDECSVNDDSKTIFTCKVQSKKTKEYDEIINGIKKDIGYVPAKSSTSKKSSSAKKKEPAKSKSGDNQYNDKIDKLEKEKAEYETKMNQMQPNIDKIENGDKKLESCRKDLEDRHDKITDNFSDEEKRKEALGRYSKYEEAIIYVSKIKDAESVESIETIKGEIAESNSLDSFKDELIKLCDQLIDIFNGKIESSKDDLYKAGFDSIKKSDYDKAKKQFNEIISYKKSNDMYKFLGSRPSDSVF